MNPTPVKFEHYLLTPRFEKRSGPLHAPGLGKTHYHYAMRVEDTFHKRSKYFQLYLEHPLVNDKDVLKAFYEIWNMAFIAQANIQQVAAVLQMPLEDPKLPILFAVMRELTTNLDELIPYEGWPTKLPRLKNAIGA